MSQTDNKTITYNKKARFEYELEDQFEAGIVLDGWEVKSLREGKVQLVDSYILIKNREAWLIGALITPLGTVSTHIKPDPRRTRKILLHRAELNKLIGLVERKGYTVIPISLYWKKNKVKISIALAKGKKLYDKRQTEKNRDWERQKQQVKKIR
ncbi:MAG: SsrA-binding protein SmpB [Gammaproteobacteria bacterium]|nr:SsrA-binding protein SmpB [Gammaproteobacteria bacterium]